ncbi:hypothetical protein Tco_1554709 [Tanacetum coccineum]
MQGAPASADTELGRHMIEFETRVRQDTDEIYTRLDDEQTERQLLVGRLNMLFKDRRAHARTARLMEAEARISGLESYSQWSIGDRRLRWQSYRDSRDPLRVLHSQSYRRRLVAVPRSCYASFNYVYSQLSIMGFKPGLEVPNDDDSHNSARKELLVYLNGLKGWSLFSTSAIIQLRIKSSLLLALSIPSCFDMWNTHVKTLVMMRLRYTQRFQELALLYGRMFPEESDKIEKYVGGLPDMIYRSVVASKPKTMQDAVEIATELMDKKILSGRRPTVFECGAQGISRGSVQAKEHNNRGNPRWKRQCSSKVYAVGRAGTDPDSNVVLLD